MAFTPSKWADGDAGGTPITAAELNRIEAAGAEAATPDSWSDVTGKPAVFPPDTHTHAIADVTGLQALLDDHEARIAALENPA